MCSVVGYVGKNYCRSVVMEALTRLEYRGYDSAGFVCLHPQKNSLIYTKSQGGIKNLLKNLERSPIDGFLGMGHTRWSTHGVASTENSHPHFDCNKSISIVHNGIIENYQELKALLQSKGHTFYSQTDTEVIAHLLESLLASSDLNLLKKDLKSIIIKLVSQLSGAYALACLTLKYPDTMIIIRKSSPLCIGYGDDEIFVASDLLGFAGKTNRVLFLPDKSFALIKQNQIKPQVELYDFSGNSLPLDLKIIDTHWSLGKKHGYEHYMLKEIYEQKKVIQDTVYKFRELSKDRKSLWSQMGFSRQSVKDLESINLIGCGSSWHAAQIARFYFEKIARIPIRVYLASELRYTPFFSERKSLVIAISQSGETADTLEGIRFINAHDIHTIALTNVNSSTMIRESKGFLFTYAGPEVAVASTKAFSAQLSVLYLLAHQIAYEKEIISKSQLVQAEENLLVTAEILENAIDDYKKEIIENLAPFYAKFKQIIFLGRYISYPFALEAALKLKEVTYIFTDCCPAGELKHGSLALIDKNIPVILMSAMDQIVYQKLISSAQEIKARSGHLVVFAFEGQTELINLADFAFIVPRVKPLLGPLALTGLVQFFVYQIAKELNRPIDQPRNLAKSVTVE